MTVSAPQRVAQVIFSTSSSMEEATAELPMLALIFTRKLRPMIIGSLSGWLMFDGMIARPRADLVADELGRTPSRMAMNSISGVMMPLARVVHLGDVLARLRAKRLAAEAREDLRTARTAGPRRMSVVASVSVYGPLVS